MHWDQPLEDDDDAVSDNDDLDQGEAFDFRVDDVPAFSGEGADILRLPYGLVIVPTPWNGEAAPDGAHIAMRFRRGAQGLMSNSKLVKWSDGSFTLQVGNEVFPVSQVLRAAPELLTATHAVSLQNALDGDNWLAVTQDTEHIMLQSKLRNRYLATTVDEAQVGRACMCLRAPLSCSNSLRLCGLSKFERKAPSGRRSSRSASLPLKMTSSHRPRARVPGQRQSNARAPRLPGALPPISRPVTWMGSTNTMMRKICLLCACTCPLPHNSLVIAPAESRCPARTRIGSLLRSLVKSKIGLLLNFPPSAFFRAFVRT